jgi:hypothetical protein
LILKNPDDLMKGESILRSRQLKRAARKERGYPPLPERSLKNTGKLERPMISLKEASDTAGKFSQTRFNGKIS